MSRVVVRPADEGDWTAIEALLTANALPLAGAREHLRTYWIAVDQAECVGVAGIEVYGPVALLRSVAVQGARRTTGIGSALVDAVMADAARVGIETLYLLTTTAADYFAAREFSVIERSEVPDGLRSSAEFRGACPDAAICMRRRVR